MSARPSYTLKYDISRRVKEADGNIREEMIRPAGTTLELRRSKGKHILAVRKITDDVEQGYYLISEATGLTIDEVGEMDTYDIGKIGGVIKNFSTDGEVTPPPISPT